MPESTRARRRRERMAVVQAGVAAGLLGGAAMWAFVTLFAAWIGLGWLTPSQAFAGVFLRDPGLRAGWGAALLGLVVHGAVSAGLGVAVTALALRRTGPLESVVAGIALATLAWIVLTFGVAPLADPALRAFASDAPFAWFASHVVFGIAVASARQFYEWRGGAGAVEARGREELATGHVRDERGGPRGRLRLGRRLATVAAVAAASLALARSRRREST